MEITTSVTYSIACLLYDMRFDRCLATWLTQNSASMVSFAHLRPRSTIDNATACVQGGRVVPSGQFLKKGLPGRVDTSGTKTTI